MPPTFLRVYLSPFGRGGCIGACVMALLVCCDNSAANTDVVNADTAFETFMASFETGTFDYLDRALSEAEAKCSDVCLATQGCKAFAINGSCRELLAIGMHGRVLCHR